MGVIQKAKNAIDSQYIHAEDAIKYLAEIEGIDNYTDIAQFLLRKRFQERCALSSYKKDNTIGDFIEVDFEYWEIPYDEHPTLEKNVFFNGAGNIYSPKTEEFLKYVAKTGELREVVNEFPKTTFPFNLYWEIQIFAGCIEGIFKEEGDSQEFSPESIMMVLETIYLKEEEDREKLNQILIGQIELQSRQKGEEQSCYNALPKTLKMANKAFARFWGNANPLEKDTQPDNSEIAAWVIEQSGKEITKTMAEKIAQIIRPEWAATGRKPTK